MESEIPANAIWMEPQAFREMVAGWLKDIKGVPYAQELMDVAHGDWTLHGNRSTEVREES